MNEDIAQRRDSIDSKANKLCKTKPKCPTGSQESCDHAKDVENDALRSHGFDRKGRGGKSSQKMKTKIKMKRQPSLEEQFPSTSDKANAGVHRGEKEAKEPAGERKMSRESSVEEESKSAADGGLSSPNSSSLRERLSTSKHSDNRLQTDRREEEESRKDSEDGIFQFLDMAQDENSERSSSVLDVANRFSRAESRDRSASSDSSDKNVSDLEKIEKGRDSSSSLEGSFYDTHISSRVRKLHEVALRQMREDNSKSKNRETADSKKRSVDFKHSGAGGSLDSAVGRHLEEGVAKPRKLKGVADGETARAAVDVADAENRDEGLAKNRMRVKKQERVVKRFSLKDGRLSQDSRFSGDRKKEKRPARSFAKTRKDCLEEEEDLEEEEEEEEEGKDEKKDEKEGGKEKESREVEEKVSEPEKNLGEEAARVGRREKKGTKKSRKAVSEEKHSTAGDLRFSLQPLVTGSGKYRSHSESAHESEVKSEKEEEERTRQSYKEAALEAEDSERKEAMLRESRKTGKVPEFPESRAAAGKEWSRPSDSAETGPYPDAIGKVLAVEDYYKLVFVSSDSSAKESRFLSSDSESGPSGSSEYGADSWKKVPSDFDWDYYLESSPGTKGVAKDRSAPGKLPGSALVERCSPGYSTSDDSSPKFARKGEAQGRPGDAGAPAAASGERGNEDAGAADVAAASEKEGISEEKEGGEEGRKWKKRRKNKKKGGIWKDGGRLAQSGDSMDEEEEEEEEEEEGAEGAEEEEEEEEAEAANNARRGPPDGVAAVAEEEVGESVEEPVLGLEVVEFKSDNSMAKDCWSKSKSKKQKSKKRSEKCAGTAVAGGGESESRANAVDDEGRVRTPSNDFDLDAGTFGYASQNIVPSPPPPPPSQLPEVLRDRQISNLSHNFVPIPVLVPIPVPFPVPAAFWTQAYHNFLFPNFAFNGDNVDLLNNIPNIRATNYFGKQNYGASRTEEDKEVSVSTAESEYSGTGNGSVHIRPISMQRPALTIGPAPAWSQGFVNSAVSDRTCLPTHQLQPHSDNDPDRDANAITKHSVDDVDVDVNVNYSRDSHVVVNRSHRSKSEVSARGKKARRARKKARRSSMEDAGLPPPSSSSSSSSSSSTARSEDDLAILLKDMFVEGKTFREVKNALRHKSDFAEEEASAVAKEEEEEERKEAEDEEESLEAEPKSTCSSSSSDSDDSDRDGAHRKPFKKCYYFNVAGVTGEGRTSDDSDVAYVSGGGCGGGGDDEGRSDGEDESCRGEGESTPSEDEGNPDPTFSEVLVLNCSDSEGASSASKYREALPGLAKRCDDASRYPESSDSGEEEQEEEEEEEDGEDDNGESSVILLKHVKKVTEDEWEESGAAVGKGQESGNGGEGGVGPREVGEESMRIRCEGPVTLVSLAAASTSGGVGVAEGRGVVPACQASAVLGDNSSEAVFRLVGDEGNCDCLEENLVEVRRGSPGNRDSEGESGEAEDERRRESAECGDVIVKDGALAKERELVRAVDEECSRGETCGRGPRVRDHVSDGYPGNWTCEQYGYPLPSADAAVDGRNRGFGRVESCSTAVAESETKYTSLVMITRENGDDEDEANARNVSESANLVQVIATDTTKILEGDRLQRFHDDICLKHTNGKNSKVKGLEEYFTMTLENSRGGTVSPKKPNIIKNMSPLEEEDETEAGDANESKEEVQVVTDDKTLSAVICLEEGLADDDSWVEDLDKDRDNDFAATATEEDTSSGDDAHVAACTPHHVDREEELRGYHRGAINFTLHTIVEESCEDSEIEEKSKNGGEGAKARASSATDLEKYFYFDIGGGGVNPSFEAQDLDTFSESSSSIYSDGGTVNENGGELREKSSEQSQLSTSRLEKYFLNFDRDGREKESDGSVGSDSEGPPSPEQRRKRLFRARASTRLHAASLDNLVQSENEQQSLQDVASDSEDSSTATHEAEVPSTYDKADDSGKRKKKRKISGGNLGLAGIHEGGEKKGADRDGDSSRETRDSLSREHRFKEGKDEAREADAAADEPSKPPPNFDNESDDDRCKTPQPELALSDLVMNRDKQQSRDSGFIGSCDDLLKEQRTGDGGGGGGSGADAKKKEASDSAEKGRKDASAGSKAAEVSSQSTFQKATSAVASGPPAAALTRKDSFNNWSSDEETNLMMSKMRQFFKAMVSVPKGSGAGAAGGGGGKASIGSSPQATRSKGAKPPQLVYFENELTRLMKTVPGIRDDQVREIVEYLSSEDTWSDSYDSSDYTSSDLEGTAAYYKRSQLQQEISESCKQIIDKFDQSKPEQEQKPKAPPRRNSSPINRETALVYQKLVASFNKITNENENPSATPHSSPPFFAKVMHHIGSRLVALMHEVSSNSSGEGSISSHKARYHKRISQKLSNVSSTTEEECGLTDESDYKPEESAAVAGPAPPYFALLHQLPRSKSHDLLLEEAKGKSLRSSSSGVSDIVEEKEASDYERFSWRGSFESALMADSRSKLILLSGDGHSSSATLAAKRRSAGDLLFLKSLSREQLDRVRSCGSIGGVALEDKNIWTTGRERNGRRSSVPDATSPGSGASADGEEDSSDSEILQERSITLPRSLQSISSSPNTNSLPRLPTTGAATAQSATLSKAHSVQHFLPNVKSARYRPPGFNRIVANFPKRAVSAPGLQVPQVPQPSHSRRDRRRNQNFHNANVSSLSVDELTIPDALASCPPMHGGSKSASPSPIVGSAKARLRRGSSSIGSPDWSDDIERLVAYDHQRQNSSSLGARSDSMASVYSGAGEGRSCSIPVRGEVEFGLQYNYKAGDLEIHVKQCRDLAAVDAKRNRSDPYVKVYLLPDKSKSGKRKTKVKKHTLNPVFDETLRFHISLNELETRTLWLTVWHSDMFGRNDFLGEVMMSLENKVFDNPSPVSYVLQERTEPFEDVLSYKGEIIIGLKFVPPDATTLQKKGKRSRGTLNVKVKEAKNLTAVKSNGISDPFCKSYLLPDKGRNSKQKTPVQRRTCNPSWNHTFVYEDVSLQELSERCLELTVWDHDRLASNEFLGGLRFSLGSGRHYGKAVDWMDSTGKEISLWQSMLEKPNLWVEGCLMLRASLDPPNNIS